MKPMGTTATSSQVHEASVCVSFRFCRCLCMHTCLWLNSSFHFCPTSVSWCPVLCFLLYVCMYACVRCLQPSYIWLVSPYHTQKHKLSGFPTTEFSLQKCFPISVIHCWCPRTQQASTFPFSSETTQFPSKTA